MAMERGRERERDTERERDIERERGRGREKEIHMYNALRPRLFSQIFSNCVYIYI